MRQAMIPVAVAFCVVMGILVYSRITQPLLARSETARIVCETRLLSALGEANKIVEEARKGTDQHRAPNLIEEGKQLKERLVEITQTVEERARGGSVGARALRTLRQIDTKKQEEFVQGTADQVLRRCPDKAKDRHHAMDAVRAVLLVLQRNR